ncbi:hypothetical protein DBR11_26160 [Pedobacter sp. HMWF019]|nr:hypothetical protein DBR11_26160 [Pedobacter sp. HMWF019]
MIEQGDKQITVSTPIIGSYKTYAIFCDTSTIIPGKTPFVRFDGSGSIDSLVKVTIKNIINGKIYYIAVAIIDGNEFGPLGRKTIGTGSGSSFLTVLNQNNKISSFNANPNSGILKAIAGQPYGTGMQMATSMALSPSKKVAYLVSPYTSNFSALTYNPSLNSFATKAGYPNGVGQNASFINTSANGKYVYIANSGSQQISAFTADDDYGNITIIGNYHAGNVPQFIVIHPSGKYLYVANARDNTITAFRRDTLTGTLTAIVPAVNVGNNPTCMAISSSGGWAYVVNNESNTLSVLKIDITTGVPKVVANYPTGANPLSVTIAPNDATVLVTNSSSNTISGFIRNEADEKLTQMYGSPFSTGGGPNQLVFSNPSFCYVTNSGDNSITGFSLSNWWQPAQSTLIKTRTYTAVDGVGEQPLQIIATGASLLPPPTKFDVHLIPRDSLLKVPWGGVLRFNPVPGATSYIVWTGGPNLCPNCLNPTSENMLIEVERGYPVQTRLISAFKGIYFRIASVNEAGIGFLSPVYSLSDYISDKMP